MRRSIARYALAAAERAAGADAAYALAGRLAPSALGGAADRLTRATREAFPGSDERWIATTVAEQLRHRAWLTLDKRTIPTLSRESIADRVRGLDGLRDVLDRSLDRGVGAIVYSIHYGRPLVFPSALETLGYPCTRLAPPRSEHQARDANTIAVGTDATKAEMLSALAGNRVLALLVDTPLARQTLAAPFLGCTLPVAVGLSHIVWESRATLVAVTTTSAAPFRFSVSCGALQLPSLGATPEAVGAALLRPFEAIVAREPGAWYGVNRVFRAMTSGLDGYS